MNKDSWILNFNSPIRLKLFDFLKTITSGTVFLFYNKNNTYSLMIKTNKRIYYPDTNIYDWSEKIQMTIENIECFYENYFGLDSNKCFNTINDSELNDVLFFYNKKVNDLKIFNF